jgi:hypothetical protein
MEFSNGRQFEAAAGDVIQRTLGKDHALRGITNCPLVEIVAELMGEGLNSLAKAVKPSQSAHEN